MSAAHTSEGQSTDASTPGGDGEASPAGGTGLRARKSLAFALMVLAVVGGVTALSRLDPPPNLPRDSVHIFRFDTHGRLMGIGAEAPGEPALIEHAEIRLDLKAIEARINGVCAQCHGQPGEDLASHACAAGMAPCVPAQHPPKNTCIKCHRHGSDSR